MGTASALWLCDGHASVEFLTKRGGRDFVLTMTATVGGARLPDRLAEQGARRPPRRASSASSSDRGPDRTRGRGFASKPSRCSPPAPAQMPSPTACYARRYDPVRASQPPHDSTLETATALAHERFPTRPRTATLKSVGNRRVTGRECARALWLLGLRAPVTEAELASAWRARIRQAHPDRHIDSEQRVEAATLLTRALNDARAVVAEWIASGRPWPSRDGTVTISLEAFEPEPWPERDPEPRARPGLPSHRPAPRRPRTRLALRRRTRDRRRHRP